MADLKLGIKITSDGAGNVTAELTKVDGAVSKLGNSVSNTQSALSNSRRSFEDYAIMLGKAHLAIMAVQQAYQSLQGLVQTADAWTNLNSRLKVVTGSHEELATALADVSSIANRYQADINSVGSAYNRLAPIAANMGKSQSDLKMALEAVSSALKLSGASVSESSETLRQFGQALSGPTVQMEEMNTIIDSASVLWQGLQRQFPQLIAQYGSLKEAVGKGALSNRELLEATIRLRDEFDRQASTMRTTVSGGWRVMLNEIEKFIGGADDAIGVSKSLADGFLFVSKAAETASSRIVDVADLINRSFESLENRFPKTSEAFAKFVDKVVSGWKLIAETIATVSGTTLDFNKAITKEEWQARGGGGKYTTGGGFGGEEATKPFFDGIKKGASESALALTKLTDKQKAVAQIVIDTAKAYKVDPAFALAIAQQESGFNQLAVSGKKAQGVMQLMPDTAKQLGVDFSDLTDNVKGGVIYLKQQEKAFHSLRLAAAAYNSGPGNVQKYGGIPPFAETQKYVKSVGALYEKWQKVLGSQGEAFVTAKDQADELSNAYKRLETHHDAMVQASIRAAKEAEASRATESQRIALDLKTAEDLAKQQLDSATTQQQRIAAVEQLRAAEENAAQRSKALVDEQIATEQGLLEIRRAAVSDELANADRYNLSISDRANLMRELLGIESEMRMLVEDRTQAEIAAASQKMGMEAQLRDMQKTKLDTEKAVADEQLRMNEAYANGVQQARLFATQSAEAFGSVGESIGKMVVGVMQFSEQLYQIDRDRENALKKISKGVADGSIDPSKQAEMTAKEQMKWADKSAQYQISMMGDITDASKGFFKEGSKGYKAMEMATKAFRMFEMAMAIKSMVLQIAGNQQIMTSDAMRTGSEVAQATARGQAKAAESIANQGSGGDPYSAFPRIAAMAALMAAAGFAVMGAMGSSGSSTSAREDRQKTQGTGTVFGDATAQSNSIANSLEIIKSNSSNDLNYSAAMLRALEDLSNSILALANQVTMTVMPSIDAAIQASGMQFGKQNISLFSGFNTQLTDSGIGWFEASLSRILKGDFTAKMYADITKSFEVMGSALSESTKTYVRDASQEVSSQIVRIFRDIVTAFQEGIKAFGLTTDSVLTALKGFKVGMEQISLKDMTMEEQTAALNAVFSKITDQMAGQLNKKLALELGPFRQAGEGMAETFFRVSEGISRAQGEMERLGLTAINYKDIIAKQGDVAAEITRQTLLTQTSLTDGLKAYVNELTGSAEDNIDAYKKLVQARNSMVTAGFGDANLDRAMINAAGGLDAFNSAMEAFTSNFLSEADRYAGDVRVLSEQFGQLGYTLPQSKEAFVALAVKLNDGTEAGKKLFGQMIALSESFAKAADEAEAIRNKYASILDPFKAISDQIKQVGEDFGKLIGGVTGDSQGRISTIESEAARNRKNLNQALQDNMADSAARSQEIVKYEAMVSTWQKRLSKELDKAPKNQDKALIKSLQAKIDDTQAVIRSLDLLNMGAVDAIKQINNDIAAVTAKEGIDKASELARLSLEKQGIIDDARLAMGATLEQIFNDIAQTIQAAQQRLQSVLDLQKSIVSQIAQLQGPGAVFNLASSDRNNAFGAIDTYIAAIKAGTARNVETEVGLLNDAQAAVMAKYNAEIAAIQEAQQAYIAAETEKLNASLAAQTEAINARTEAAIKAENDRLNAALKVQQKADEAVLKGKQKEFDASNKLVQKQFDEEQKALSKIHEAQLQALQDELDAANKLSDAIKSIAEYAAGLALSQNATLSPEARLAEAQRQYQTLVGKAQGGDVEAMGKLAGASDAYLEAAKTYYGSSTNYQDIFDGVQKAMTAIGGMSAPDPDSIQSRIDQLREAQAAEMDALRELQAEKLDAIREIQAEQLDVIREQQQANLDAMREASQAQQDTIRKAAQSQIEALQKQTQQAIADLSDPTKNRAMAEAKAAAERDMKELARLAELTRSEAETQARLARDAAADQAQKAWDLANDQYKRLGAANDLGAATLVALNEILRKNAISTIPIPAYAKGGYAQAGLALVGEQGPEIVRFDRPAQVMTADETRDALRGGNDGKIVQAIAELKAEMRAVVVTQSNANPQIINKLTGMEDRLNQIERTNKLAATSK